ncbi:MAG TPA: beta-N-acetylhexosaminidase [Rhodanobacteraceae bacterium]|nr:beta-N-acetylhexosaminidase [Rhodanobacteraceae bacterium]
MLLIGIAGTTLQAHERAQLRAPTVSGLVLFARNFVSRGQLAALVAEVRDVRDDALICVDQEGGPVQRFRAGFTPLPALARLGEAYDRDRAAAVALAEEHAWLMASEVRALDVDLSFAPVLDLARGNRAIGRRALHATPAAVSELAQAYVRGMHLAGMAATLKHFPGHGSVVADTHVDAAVDTRSLAALREADLVPFAETIEAGAEAVMMAHVVYPAVDAAPAGQSRAWIETVLRGELGFRGMVFSDDISMAAAGAAGGVAARVHAHLDAGCDLVLACQPDAVGAALEAVRDRAPCDPERVAALRGAAASSWDALVDNPQRDRFIARVTALEETNA